MNWRNFLKGMGSVFNLFSFDTPPEIQAIINKTPEEAIAEDFKTVGDDLHKVMKDYEQDRNR